MYFLTLPCPLSNTLGVDNQHALKSCCSSVFHICEKRKHILQLQQRENCAKKLIQLLGPITVYSCTQITNSFKTIFPNLTNTGRETWSSMTVYSCTLSTTTTCIFLPVSSSTASPPVPILPTVSHLCLTFSVDPTRWQLKTAQSQNILWSIGKLAHWAFGKPNKCSKYLLTV